MDVKPNFFIVGAPRCGTTALYSYLRQHPDVFLPDYKEPHFFNTDMNSGGAIRDDAEYLALFASARDQARIGEASVYYLSSQAAPERIKSFCPTAKIVVMLRNPVDAVDALHAHQVAAWLEDVWDLELSYRPIQRFLDGRTCMSSFMTISNAIRRRRFGKRARS